MDSLIGDKYVVKEHLGRGSYGDVYRAFDVEGRVEVALKFVQKTKSNREARIMEIVQNQGHAKKKYVARLLDIFSYKNYRVYVQELLYKDLYGASKKQFKDGFVLKKIASIGLQLCKALCQFESVTLKDKGKTSLIHGDLKMDNVMFTDKSCTSIKIIDFGLAFFHHERRLETTQSRTTRAPESLFNGKTRQTTAVDMWSVGVLLFTLFRRENMFNSSSEEEQIANLVYAFGEPPARMMESKMNVTKYFNMDGDKLSLKSMYISKATQKSSFGEMFEQAAAAPIHEQMKATVWMENFKDLLLMMFELDPDLRLKPQEAIRHPFFRLLKKKNSFMKLLEKLKMRGCFSDLSNV